ncbi:selenocysteine-specific translation elongation factor [Campylobacter sp. FMV-PI01]|uniref:Selenocysteine-specific translation elongation factor n=1 Tax=Campylobacter portucalensis TaxID=2608384 RepID=A0A6L5WI77_9BACT|nr:selenocysteine-specific translation elongation factor [Campylobacter portucalensis]MSN95957.1 selenocysteine-specific translation elongation factor [Campylobacter portucalensis]
MNTIIIGTAGHIDHGKTALIKALNGFEGDEMKSEKERGITIDLSFSNLKNKDSNIAFIDVPGHENLIKTMISGAYGFDAAMLVVASDDSIMPQTKEHIEILSLLGVKSIILCISKCDLTDIDQQKSVELEAKKYIKKFSNLEILKTFFISVKDEISIKELKNYLFTLKPKAHDITLLTRYYIDRVFALKGVGTIVTGSLIDGNIKKNEKLICLDNNKEILVRNIEVHSEFQDFIQAPNRVALNLSNVSVSDLQKGFILTKKGFFRGFKEVDCVFYGKISHNQDVVFCVGSKQISAKALILSVKDDSKFITFKFTKDMFLKFDEPFVILLNSRVIGGGRVLNPILEPLKKPEKIKLLAYLLNKNFIKVFETLTQNHKHGFGLISSFQRFNMDHENALNIALNLKDVFVDKKNLCIYPLEAKKDVKDFIKFIISKNEYAIFSATSINLRLSWASDELATLCLNELQEQNLIEKYGALYIKNGVDFENLSQNLSQKIFNILEKSSITPPAPYNLYDDLDIDRLAGDNALKSLTQAKKVVRLAHNIFITTQNLNLVLQEIRQIIKEVGFANVQNVKLKLNISRKFALAYLEYLDKFDDIKNMENNRVLLNTI